MIASHSTLGSRGYIFFINTDGSRRIHVNEAQSAKKKKITPGHRSYESHFLAIFGIMYLIKPVWSWCACLFSLMLTAEIWSYVTLRLICNAWKKNGTKAYLERKVLLKIVTNCFPKKYTSRFKYMNRTGVSWEVPTLYVFRSQQDKKNFWSMTLVLLFQVKLNIARQNGHAK